MKVTETTHVQLTTPPENGTAVRAGSIQPASIEGEITIASIGTDVTVRYDASDDGFSTTVQGTPVVYTANGTYRIDVPVGYAEVRPVFVAETGGTPTVDVVTKTFY